jgi:type IV secretion system protein TrbC
MFLAALPVNAQTGASPCENAVNALKTSFIGAIAQGLSLVVIVVSGLMFAYGEASRRRCSRHRHGHRRCELPRLALSVVNL